MTDADDFDDSDVMPSLPWYATHPRITSLATSFAVWLARSDRHTRNTVRSPIRRGRVSV